MEEYIQKLYNILVNFLGESKSGVSNNLQIEFACPRCIENKGENERMKYNLSVSLLRQKFQCWSCCSHDDGEMHGSIKKLFRLYGNESLWNEYKGIINDLRNNELYKLNYNSFDFNIDNISLIEKEELRLPNNFHKFNKSSKNNPYKALDYLFKRNIDWDIINEFGIGYTSFDENNKQISSRIIIPSYNEYGELNYWTGRDFTSLEYRQKYFNPKIERKDIIFNEEKISWDEDINLVEGPFDHIVVPNSIPLLGKKLSTDFKIYTDLNIKANSNINIWLDGDAYESVKEIYKLLNHGRLYNKIRYIPTSSELDPSEIFQKWGRKGIIMHLKNASKIDELL